MGRRVKGPVDGVFRHGQPRSVITIITITMSNGHAHTAGPQVHGGHHRHTSSNGSSGLYPSENTALMQEARLAYRLNDVESSRCMWLTD